MQAQAQQQDRTGRGGSVAAGQRGQRVLLLLMMIWHTTTQSVQAPSLRWIQSRIHPLERLLHALSRFESTYAPPLPCTSACMHSACLSLCAAVRSDEGSEARPGVLRLMDEARDAGLKVRPRAGPAGTAEHARLGFVRGSCHAMLHRGSRMFICM